ncbi:hypothetical protein E3P77_01948 [Wallemia ichthyophaga]|nr:hypothetical protein E3P77_01948 [Wallemia ichthyophaga]
MDRHLPAPTPAPYPSKPAISHSTSSRANSHRNKVRKRVRANSPLSKRYGAGTAPDNDGYPDCDSVGNDVVTCYPSTDTSLTSGDYSKIIWNPNLPQFTENGNLDIYLFSADTEQVVESWQDVPNQRGSQPIHPGDNWWSPIDDSWGPYDAQDPSQWSDTTRDWTYYAVLKPAGQSLDGGEEHQATFTAVQTAPLQNLVQSSSSSSFSLASSRSSVSSVSTVSSASTAFTASMSDPSFASSVSTASTASTASMSGSDQSSAATALATESIISSVSSVSSASLASLSSISASDSERYSSITQSNLSTQSVLSTAASNSLLTTTNSNGDKITSSVRVTPTGVLQNQSADDDFPAWAIAVIVVLGVLALLGIAGGMYLLARHWRSARGAAAATAAEAGGAAGGAAGGNTPTQSEPLMKEHQGAGAGAGEGAAAAGAAGLGAGAGAAAAGAGARSSGASSENGNANGADREGPITSNEAAAMADAFRQALRSPGFDAGAAGVAAGEVTAMAHNDAWISDAFLTHLGVADGKMVEYAKDIASTAKSTESLYSKLTSLGFPAGADVSNFAAHLYSAVPKKSKHKHSFNLHESRDSRKKKERLAVDQNSQRYGLLLEDDNDDNGNTPSTSNLPPKKRDKKSKDKRSFRRRDDDDAWKSDDEDKSRKRARDISPSPPQGGIDDNIEDEDAKERRLVEEDARERDEFAERMKDKDRDRTKKLVEDRTNDSETVLRRKLADDKDARKEAMPDLRLRSRQEYLTKREMQQLELLKKSIADEESMFAGVAMSRQEIEELDRKKAALALAEERLRIDDKVDGYMLPDDYITEQGKIDSKKKNNVLYARYEEGKKGQDPSEFVTDVDQWEKEQTDKAQLTTGAQDREVTVDDYDFVFDESQTIKFIADSTLSGNKRQTTEQAQMEASIQEAENRAKSIDQVRKSLPIYDYRGDILQAVQDHPVLIVCAETGSGKTTQLTQYLHEAGYTKNGRKIGCTQPRRVAAMSVAARVAEEMGSKVGYDVGYSIRFEDMTTDKTMIKYLTDGMLLREFLTEPDLASYSALIIDEAHERTLSTDILFGLVKDIARYRPDLRLLISSATMDAEKFSEYFDDAPVFYGESASEEIESVTDTAAVPGRRYPIDIHYTPQPEANYLHAAVTTVFQIHTTQPRGDILVFLTGQDEIEAAAENIQETARVLGDRIPELLVCPIYANLPSEMQAKIFEPTPQGARKVVLATNIAETSITIDGVVFVIDPGFVKQNAYNPRTGMSSLIVTPCSRAAAKQRAGRAGRVGPGKCFRLYTKWAHNNELDESTVPEIQRTNLGMVVLMLKSLGINDLIGFDFMDPPPGETIIKALEMLYALGALNSKGELTKMGRRMAEFPVDPMLSKSILASEGYGCTDEVLSIIAMLSESASLFFRPKDKKMHADKARQNFIKPGGDHFTLLNVWQQWADTGFSQQWCYENYVQYKVLCRVRDIRDQLAGLCERVELFVESSVKADDIIPIQKAILSGYFYNTARMDKGGGSYRTLKTNQTVHIHPTSSAFNMQPPPRHMLFYELVLTSKEYMRQIMPIQSSWLAEVAPHYFTSQDLQDLNTSNRKMPKAVGK